MKAIATLSGYQPQCLTVHKGKFFNVCCIKVILEEEEEVICKKGRNFAQMRKERIPNSQLSVPYLSHASGHYPLQTQASLSHYNSLAT
jgi:hypothetical protein